jgi:hypothetical protein
VHASARPRHRRQLALVTAVLVGLAAIGVVVAARSGTSSAPQAAFRSPDPAAGRATTSAPTTTNPPTSAPTRSPEPTPTPTCSVWGCAQDRRFAAAEKLLGSRPGRLGIAVLDRRTGAVWGAGTVDHLMWASSTPKLALATALLERSRAGTLTLDATARRQIDAMLAVSDDDAADALWDRYGGQALVPTFRDVYGMHGITFVPGFPRRWGFLKCSAEDLRHLMTYVLARLDGPDREHIVTAMRTTGSIQHWGVWAAGPPQQPGAKDGWSIESDAGVRHWCTSSVGFAGPDGRYVVAVMDDLPAGSTIGAGVHAVSDLVATVFGRPTPAPVTVPDEGTGR